MLEKSVIVRTLKVSLSFILLFSLIVKRLTTISNIAEQTWPRLREVSKVYKEEGYMSPTKLWTTKWGVHQFGWSATCRTKGCGEVWCVSIAQAGNGLSVPRCCNPDGGTGRRVHADNACIAKYEQKKFDV
jgi:hypothetical protein